MNINLVWQDIVRNILKQDIIRLPRGMVTKEILNYNSTIDMNFPFLNQAVLMTRFCKLLPSSHLSVVVLL